MARAAVASCVVNAAREGDWVCAEPRNPRRTDASTATCTDPAAYSSDGTPATVRRSSPLAATGTGRGGAEPAPMYSSGRPARLSRVRPDTGTFPERGARSGNVPAAADSFRVPPGVGADRSHSSQPECRGGEPVRVSVGKVAAGGLAEVAAFGGFWRCAEVPRYRYLWPFRLLRLVAAAVAVPLPHCGPLPAALPADRPRRGDPVAPCTGPQRVR
jgi:hypothetical protein